VWRGSLKLLSLQRILKLKTFPIAILVVIGFFLIGCASFDPQKASVPEMSEVEKEEGMKSIVSCLTMQIFIHDDGSSAPEQIAPLVAQACHDEIEDFRLKAIRGQNQAYIEGFTEQWEKIKEPTICRLIVRVREEGPKRKEIF
jgi:hypothetical protein